MGEGLRSIDGLLPLTHSFRCAVRAALSQKERAQQQRFGFSDAVTLNELVVRNNQ
jgi:hypothetical protein